MTKSLSYFKNSSSLKSDCLSYINKQQNVSASETSMRRILPAKRTFSGQQQHQRQRQVATNLSPLFNQGY